MASDDWIRRTSVDGRTLVFWGPTADAYAVRGLLADRGIDADYDVFSWSTTVNTDPVVSLWVATDDAERARDVVTRYTGIPELPASEPRGQDWGLPPSRRKAHLRYWYGVLVLIAVACAAKALGGPANQLLVVLGAYMGAGLVWLLVWALPRSFRHQQCWSCGLSVRADAIQCRFCDARLGSEPVEDTWH